MRLAAHPVTPPPRATRRRYSRWLHITERDSAMKPFTHFVRRSCWGLAAALALQAPLAQAELIGPDAVMAAQPLTQEQLDRAKVQQFLDSAALKDRLRALGVD